MKGKTKKPKKRPSLNLIEKKTAVGKIFTFPGVRGRTVEMVRLFTNTDEQTISINFQDKTFLNFSFEPGFVLEASLADMKTGNFETIKEWPPIPSEPRNPT